MAKNKQFLIRHEYLHILSCWDNGTNGGKDVRKNDTHYPVQVSDYDAIKAKLFAAVSDPKDLNAILQSEFIYEELSRKVEVPHDTFEPEYRKIPVFNPYPVTRYPVSAGYAFAGLSGAYSYTYEKNPNYGFGQKDTNTYATHKVATVLEELVLNHGADFRALLSAAPLECKRYLLDFTDLDLTGAQIADLEPSLMNFTRSNLQNTPGITQLFLDNSETYEDAILPHGIQPFWTEEKKEKVLQGLAKLAQYGHNLKKSSQEGAKQKGQLAGDLAKTLTNKILSAEKYNSVFQKDFLSTLHQHDQAFSEKRDHGFKMIISNIALCILGLGIGYLAAGIAHYQQTGRFFFFNRPETEQQVAKIQGVVCPVM